MLASGSYDPDTLIKLWDIHSSQCLKTWKGNAKGVTSLVFSPDGATLASGGLDETIKLWDVHTGECLRTLEGHINWVNSIAFHPNGNILVSGSQDETVKLWHIKTGECLKTLRSERPYEGMNITGVTGLTEAEKASLKALGAVEL